MELGCALEEWEFRKWCGPWEYEDGESNDFKFFKEHLLWVVFNPDFVFYRHNKNMRPHLSNEGRFASDGYEYKIRVTFIRYKKEREFSMSYGWYRMPEEGWEGMVQKQEEVERIVWLPQLIVLGGLELPNELEREVLQYNNYM